MQWLHRHATCGAMRAYVMPPASALLYSAAGGCGLHSVVVWAMVSQSMGGVLGFRLPMPQQGHAACALVTAAAR